MIIHNINITFIKVEITVLFIANTCLIVKSSKFSQKYIFTCVCLGHAISNCISLVCFLSVFLIVHIENKRNVIYLSFLECCEFLLELLLISE